jgi:hypothetical protein
MSKTYLEAKTERLRSMAVAEIVEVGIEEQTDATETPEVTADVSEVTAAAEVVESEIVDQAEQIIEVEPETEPEPTPEPELVVEAESTSEGESVAEDSEGADETGGPVTEVETTQSPGIVLITVQELNEVCEADSEAAEAMFAGSTLQITAKIGRIPSMESGEKPCLILISPERPTAMNILCIFDKQHEAAINKLSEGQMVTVQGRYDGCVMNILVNDCILID